MAEITTSPLTPQPWRDVVTLMAARPAGCRCHRR
ncbi:hypothetical protein JOE57_002444 [Microlunatus panaciterrae]|uniref:Uncharacterized protein n=1 Tax=Microlunatus panaciterrae TaxID=400768 RepID=A0ABS2RLC4_9ACTN|nr:hypothetical protein [Microlunatus panaciterrae]